ncbi:tetrahydromethanopterin S-methyltransferase subunit B [ANME-1 cluster archaeon ex4572_4]|nr:tetrahydromethanopterin S-methyltransferase subunit B [Methanophagales archaeon]OYT67005.1 MAG: tetrahydromethanopterin S-methyltransferase subunit B [ANME-1 cluster archaeon ex4572_4]PXF51008.1 MAG: tetrahydromethanopterin S-methyltransferase subunit B [Methanophagales archaeon]
MLVINEKFGVVLDPDSLTVGVARPGFYKVNLAPIEEQITALETSVDDLFNCLDPTSGFVMSQPRREGALNTAGFVTMLVFGVIFGVLAVTLALFKLGIGLKVGGA